MRIISLNLAGYKDWPHRESKILDYLNKARADVVFLQEVKFDQSYTAKSQSEYISQQLAEPFDYSQSTVSRIYTTSDGTESREGLAVFSRHLITHSEIIVLKKRSDDKHTRIFQNVDIVIGGTTQKFTNVHFSNNAYSREQLEEFLGILKANEEQRIILGDFNMYDLSAVKHLFENDYIDSSSFDYVSFPSENVRLDYALIPKNFEFKSFAVRGDLSDHNALEFEL